MAKHCASCATLILPFMCLPTDSVYQFKGCRWHVKCRQLRSFGHTVQQAHYMAAVLTGLPATCSQVLTARASPKASPQSGWALRALKLNSAKQTQMLEALLKQHLQKQLLLAGNPVIVPVLGHHCVFRLKLPMLSILCCYVSRASVQAL